MFFFNITQYLYFFIVEEKPIDLSTSMARTFIKKENLTETLCSLPESRDPNLKRTKGTILTILYFMFFFCLYIFIFFNRNHPKS